MLVNLHTALTKDFSNVSSTLSNFNAPTRNTRNTLHFGQMMINHLLDCNTEIGTHNMNTEMVYISAINNVVVELLTALTEYHSVCNVSSTL